MNPFYKSIKLALIIVMILIANYSYAMVTYDGVMYECYGDGSAYTSPLLRDRKYSGNITVHGMIKNIDELYTVVGIGNGTFSECYELTSVSLPETITTIRTNAFLGCHDLSTKISLPNVTFIGDFAFSGCKSIPSIYLGDNVTHIGQSAFQGCSSISEIIIPNGVTTIEAGVFANCTNLKTINFHCNPDSIKVSAFSDCTSLETIKVPNSVKFIGERVFSGCTSLKNIILPEGLEYIDECTFYMCESLDSIILPQSITYINEQAFAYCSNLKSIVIPNNVHSIYNRGFEYCSSLEKVYLGKKISSIGYGAFTGCSSIKEVYSANPIPPTVKIDSYYGDTPFEGVDVANVNLYVPNGSATAYKNHSFWKKFNIIEDKPEVNENVRSVYAYDLSMSGDNGLYSINFKATGDAEANIILTDVQTGDKTVVEIGQIVKGVNSVELNADDYGIDKEFNWAIEVKSPAIEEASLIFDATTSGRTIQTNARGGVVFIKDTESDAFGKVVVSNGFSQGIDIYSATQQLESTTKFSGDINNAASSYRCAENNGIVYIADWSDASSGVYTFDPANPATPTQWFNGTRNSEGVFTNASGSVIGGSVSGLDFSGKGDDAQLILFGKDYPASNSQLLVGYNSGNAKTWGNTPNATFPNVSALMLNTNVDIETTRNGFFASQVRYAGNNIEAVPAFIYADYNDNILYNSGTTGVVNGGSGAIAINDEETLLAVATPDEGIIIFDVAWTENGVPSLTKLYALPNSISSNNNGELSQLDFDIAGNLHAFLRNDGYRVYALPYEKPTAVTAAKKSLIIKGTTSGVENVDADGNAIEVARYDIYGRLLSEPTKGINIVKYSDGTTRKECVK